MFSFSFFFFFENGEKRILLNSLYASASARKRTMNPVCFCTKLNRAVIWKYIGQEFQTADMIQVYNNLS